MHIDSNEQRGKFKHASIIVALVSQHLIELIRVINHKSYKFRAEF